ncbi:hypothetical protein J2T17_007176 [Paenibacillus mucilaginosus]|uniref:hypothetical protein n=1 Tax=Paenibacillus mucilaginosus TaxID=61624 RepID=UPI003D1F5C2F
MILDVIYLTSDPAATIENGNKNMVNICIQKGIKTLERTPDLSVEEQFRLVREHFGFMR